MVQFRWMKRRIKNKEQSSLSNMRSLPFREPSNNETLFMCCFCAWILFDAFVALSSLCLLNTQRQTVAETATQRKIARAAAAATAAARLFVNLCTKFWYIRPFIASIRIKKKWQQDSYLPFVSFPSEIWT